MTRLLFFLLWTLVCSLTACYSIISPEIIEISYDSPRDDAEPDLLQQFYTDAKVPEHLTSILTDAINGDPQAQAQINEEVSHSIGDSNKLDWSVENGIFPYSGNNTVYSKGDCYYNIGMMYYTGKDYIDFPQNKQTSFLWFEASAEHGSSRGALMAGDMAICSDGVPYDQLVAFKLYSKAHEINPNGNTYQRLGDCYEKGIGTDVNIATANDYYVYSAMQGNPLGFYGLISLGAEHEQDMLSLYKVASSLDYSSGYFAMAYGGVDGSRASQQKQEAINYLEQSWDNSTDTTASYLKKRVDYNQYYSKNFVEQLMKVSYAYSYHSFAEKYAVHQNRGFADVDNISFAESDSQDRETRPWFDSIERYFKWEGCAFYEYDFNGDGEDEIGIPVNSGAGGAFMTDGFVIYKKNRDGLYEYFSESSYCAMRDAKRIINFEGVYYFIANPFSDTGDSLHNIVAQRISREGKSHMLYLNCSNYRIKPILIKTENEFSIGFDDLISKIHQQANDAIAVTKLHEIYSPKEQENIESSYVFEEPNMKWYSDSYYQNVLFSADIDNDGMKEVIHKGLLILQSKYYDEYNILNVYEDLDEFIEKSVPIDDELPSDGSFGIHSWGSAYDVLPFNGRIVQLWTTEYDGKTYISVLTRSELLYTVHTCLVENEKSSVVSEAMFFDEVQDMEINYETSDRANLLRTTRASRTSRAH